MTRVSTARHNHPDKFLTVQPVTRVEADDRPYAGLRDDFVMVRFVPVMLRISGSNDNFINILVLTRDS